jgi:hypothetical protein
MAYEDAFVVVPDEFWNEFIGDEDDYLTQTEFMSAVSAFDNGQIKGTPWLVYSLQETEHLTDFYVDYYSIPVSIDFGESEDQCSTPRMVVGQTRMAIQSRARRAARSAHY